jgi:hypothetical protein
MKLFFHGGLGDIVRQFIAANERLNNIAENEYVDILIHSTNPYAHELFAYHPALKELDPEFRQVTMVFTEDTYNAWVDYEDMAIPADRELTYHTLGKFGGSLQDKSAYDAIVRMFDHFNALKGVIVVAAGAGNPEQQLPRDWCVEAIKRIYKEGFLPVVVGRNYERMGRSEPLRDLTATEAQVPIINYIDDLTVPGVLGLMGMCDGVLASDSSVAVMGKIMETPLLTGKVNWDGEISLTETDFDNWFKQINEELVMSNGK